MYLGIDIGGTKTAVVISDDSGKLLKKEKFATTGPNETIDKIIFYGRELLGGEIPLAIGVSCGSPQDSEKGLILEPPNLPNWKNIPICQILKAEFKANAYLMNDADACALAEWKFGAGKGTENMIFLTFGTGLGAGIILNGKLYQGSSHSAGEVGHIRLEKDGPIGYGKAGSFEGFCSGGGIFQLCGKDVKTLAEDARKNDEKAIEIFNNVAEKLGAGLSILIDIFNPDAIVIGSIFTRCEDLLREKTEKSVLKESLKLNREVCKILPAALGENLGDYASITVAINGRETNRCNDSIFVRYPQLKLCENDIDTASRILIETAKNNGTVLVCGNGGSACDSEHIVGELMKGFCSKRPIDEKIKSEWKEKFNEEMPMLQKSVKAISLPSQIGVLSAFANDVSAKDVYAQLAYGYAQNNDVLIVISTSGNSENCLSAAKAALMKGAKVIALTGAKESKLSKIATVTIKAPETETYKIQELHLPIYHELCLRIERELF